MKQKLLQKGFTLIELLGIILFISLLAVVVFIVLDPVKRFTDAKNVHRISDVNAIFSAVHQAVTQSNGELPAGLSVAMAVTQIGTAAYGCDSSCAQATASACVNLNGSLAKYLKHMPQDPDIGTSQATGYYVVVDANNTLTVGACRSEHGSDIAVSKNLSEIHIE